MAGSDRKKRALSARPRLVWTAEEVDAQLHKMMVNIHKVSAEAAEEYGLGYDLVAGANIAGFKKVAEAMYQQGMF